MFNRFTRPVLILVTVILISAFTSCTLDDLLGDDDEKDKDPGAYITFTIDGTTYRYTQGFSDTGYSTGAFGSIDTTNSQTYIYAGSKTTTESSYQSSGEYIWIYLYDKNTGNHTNADHALKIYFSSARYYQSDVYTCNVNVTGVDGVNGYITGTFSGLYTFYDNGSIASDGKSISGSFRVKRIADDKLFSF